MPSFQTNALVVPSIGGNNFGKSPPNCLVGLVNEVERLLSHLNSIGPSILFTFERENEKCRPSLDLIAYVHRTDRGDPEQVLTVNPHTTTNTSLSTRTILFAIL